jgi:excisionase family DNA binding protein
MHSEHNRTEPLSISVDAAARIVGIGRTRMFGLVGNGTIPSFKIGRTRLIRTQDLRDFVNRAARGEVR